MLEDKDKPTRDAGAALIYGARKLTKNNKHLERVWKECQNDKRATMALEDARSKFEFRII